MEIHARSEWGARPPRARTAMRPSVEPTAHWMGTEEGVAATTWDEAVRLLQGVQRTHMDVNNWSDIAYNFAVDQSGRVWECRGVGIRSAANGTTPGNDSSYGVLFLVGPGDEVTDTMVVAADRLAQHLGTRPAEYRGHNSWKSTDCPGPIVMRRIVTNTDFGGIPMGTEATEQEIKSIQASVNFFMRETNTTYTPPGGEPMKQIAVDGDLHDITVGANAKMFEWAITYYREMVEAQNRLREAEAALAECRESATGPGPLAEALRVMAEATADLTGELRRLQ